MKNAKEIELITTPRDKRWYTFRWRCELHQYMDCNLHSPEEMHTCLRPNRDGTPRKHYDPAQCKVGVCPILKCKIKPSEDQEKILKEPVRFY